MTAGQVRYMLSIYDGWLSAGRWPRSERAPDEKARGRVQFGSRPPGPAILAKCDLDQAIARLPPVLESVVWAKIRWGSTGRAARHLHRRKHDVQQDLDAAVELLAAALSPPESSLDSPLDGADRLGVACMVSG